MGEVPVSYDNAFASICLLWNLSDQEGTLAALASSRRGSSYDIIYYPETKHNLFSLPGWNHPAGEQVVQEKVVDKPHTPKTTVA